MLNPHKHLGVSMTIPTDRGYVRIVPDPTLGNQVEIYTSDPADHRERPYAVHSWVERVKIERADAFVRDGEARVSVRPLAVSWAEATATLTIMDPADATL